MVKRKVKSKSLYLKKKIGDELDAAILSAQEYLECRTRLQAVEWLAMMGAKFTGHWPKTATLDAPTLLVDTPAEYVVESE